MQYTGSMEGYSYSELFGGPEIPVFRKNVTLAKGTAYKRGMLLSEADGIVSPTAKNGTAAYVMEGDMDLTEAAENAVGTVYTSGRFNRERLIAADGDTVDAHEAELRPLDILLTSLHEQGGE